jgi:hypothetical protein
MEILGVRGTRTTDLGREFDYRATMEWLETGTGVPYYWNGSQKGF